MKERPVDRLWKKSSGHVRSDARVTIGAHAFTVTRHAGSALSSGEQTVCLGPITDVVEFGQSGKWLFLEIGVTMVTPAGGVVLFVVVAPKAPIHRWHGQRKCS